MLWLPLALVWAGACHMAAQLVYDQHGPGRHRVDLITPANSSASRLTPATSAPELFDQPDEAGEDTDLRLLQTAREATKSRILRTLASKPRTLTFRMSTRRMMRTCNVVFGRVVMLRLFIYLSTIHQKINRITIFYLVTFCNFRKLNSPIRTAALRYIHLSDLCGCILE